MWRIQKSPEDVARKVWKNYYQKLDILNNIFNIFLWDSSINFNNVLSGHSKVILPPYLLKNTRTGWFKSTDKRGHLDMRFNASGNQWWLIRCTIIFERVNLYRDKLNLTDKSWNICSYYWGETSPVDFGFKRTHLSVYLPPAFRPRPNDVSQVKTRRNYQPRQAEPHNVTDSGCNTLSTHTAHTARGADGEGGSRKRPFMGVYRRYNPIFILEPSRRNLFRRTTRFRVA